MPIQTNSFPIATPQPTFASTIRNQDRQSLSSHRRSGSQFSSGEERNEQPEESPQPMFPGTKLETTIPLYNRLENKSSFEGVHDGLGVWGRRTYKSHDLESGGLDIGTGREPLSRQTTCISTQGSFLPLSAVQKPRAGTRGGKLWEKCKMRCRRWTESVSPQRKAVLVLEITLAGLVLGIIIGLGFGVTENMAQTSKGNEYVVNGQSPRYVGYHE